MVCLGNICRSPLAHGILQSKLSSDGFFVDSAGTSGFHEGNLPDSRSIAVAKQYGIDITNQRSRKFTVSDYDNFDLIFAMDSSNFNDILKLSRGNKDAKKVRLILNEIENYTDKDVPDPYYGGDNGFSNVYKMLEAACTVIAAKLK